MLIKLTLARRLLIYSIFVLLLPTVLLGSYINQLIEEKLTTQLEDSLKHNLEFSQLYIKSQLDHIQSSAEVIATDPELRKALDRDNSLGLNSQLNRIASVYQELNYIVLIDSYFSVFAVNTIDSLGNKISSEDILGNTVESFDNWPELSVAAKYGTPGKDKLVNQFGLEDKQAQIVTAPVLIRGEAKGWVILSFRWQQAVSTFLTSFEKTLKEQDIPVLGMAINYEQSTIAGSISNIDENKTYRTNLFIGETAYEFVLQVSSSIFDDIEREQQRLFFIFVLPSLAIILLILYIIIHQKILKPIKELELGATKYAQGDYTHRIDVVSTDELAALCHSFNDMGAKLNNSKIDLENRVLSRTHELNLSNNQLEKAVKDAELASEAKGMFLANMSHEIRTPMNGVLGMLDLLNDTRLDKTQQHYQKLASTSAQSLLILINDILDFSKIESGKLDLENIDFDVVQVLGDLAESMAYKAEEKNIELLLDINQLSKSHVNGDPNRVRQILTNLVNNAIKFTEQGEIVITVKTREERSKVLLSCSIKDTGIGIAQQKIAELFESFSQADATTTRKFGGTGLGLSIVKQLCVLMGGDVHATSELGKGSCFTFELVLGTASISAPEIPDIDLQGKEILIVDDNRTNLEILKTKISGWGANVTSTNSAKNALKVMFERKPALFDVAIIDMSMPEMSGEELGKRIREVTVFDGTKLIMSTSVRNRGDAQLMANLGFQAYLPKPTTPQALLDVLKVVISQDKNSNVRQPLVTQHNLHSYSSAESINLKGKALLVEDNKINQVIARTQVKKLGLEVDIANNGQEALDILSKAESNEYVIILMDCQMPVLDGFETTIALRNGEAGAEAAKLPIIAMTANAMKGDREQCLSVGMDEYLSKPLDVNKLQKTLKLFLEST